MTYKAIVTKIQVQPHPNADKLQIGMCCGSRVVVGLETKSGDLGVFFPTDGQLSQEFCDANDLCTRYDENGKKIGGGFFDEKLRVRAQSFRGVKSDGYWVPETYIYNMTSDSALEFLTEGMQLDTYMSIPLCNKYITPQTKAAQNSNKVASQPKYKVDMPKHVDTENIKYHINDFKPGDLITVTRKLHGTSGRYGHVKQESRIKINWIQRLGAFLFGDKASAVSGYADQIQWNHIIGTRNTIITDNNNQGYYGNEQFRHDAVNDIVLHKGEILYFEIVGYVNEHRLIMEQPIHASIQKSHKLDQAFGSSMRYTYGCSPGTCDIYVYRITQQAMDGRHIELPWNQVKARCAELSLKHVPEYYKNRGNSFVFNEWDSAVDLISMFDTCINGQSGQEAIPEPIDANHIIEGIVIRVDNAQGTHFYKMKSWMFSVLEGIIKDNPEYVDIEEVS